MELTLSVAVLLTINTVKPNFVTNLLISYSYPLCT